MRWLVVGAGSFGTAITHVLGDKNIDLTLAARTSAQVEELEKTRINVRYFPNIKVPKSVTFTTVDEAQAQQWDLIILAVPTGAFAETIQKFANQAPLFLSLGKGLDPSGRRLSEVASEYVKAEQFMALSGPNIAREIMHDLPTAAVIAGTDSERVVDLQKAITTLAFRVYASTDVVGVELAGAQKNVLAIAAGVLEGSGFGDNAVAAMMTRGLGEMARLGLAHGAQLQTYLGLAGVGDLMVTCTSPHSRNHRAGRLFAEGLSAVQVRESIGQVVEGIRAAPIIAEMGRRANVEMHICEAVSQVVAHDAPLADVVQTMMSRPPGFEFAEDTSDFGSSL